MITIEKPRTTRASHIADGKLRFAVAGPRERQAIYRQRYSVYARELKQHPPNDLERLQDTLDEFNVYITAYRDGRLAGFISITPPDRNRFSIDKYLERDSVPIAFDRHLFEIRLLTVLPAYRHGPLATLLMYAALRWIEARGGKQIVAIGRREVLGLYTKLGLRSLGRTIQAGEVTYELMAAEVENMSPHVERIRPLLDRLETRLDWRVDAPFRAPAACYHGGKFFDAIGNEFDRLDRRNDIINADVLDAWFDPSPKVIRALQDHLPWLLRTSPPTGCEGMVSAIARVRGVAPDNILPGAGSSDLIFLALQRWLTAKSRALILDPMYGEYAHVLEKVIGCTVDRLILRREDGYAVNHAAFAAAMKRDYDLVVIVNPNSPTGRHVPGEQLQHLLENAPSGTRIWIDETYVEYAGVDQSLERFAAESRNVVVCKSMSKVYALSGARAAYLCGPRSIIDSLRPYMPPWAVSLPGQVAAVAALSDPDYYAARHQETHKFRDEFAVELARIGNIEIVPSVGNFLLCHLSAGLPTAGQVVAECRKQGLFIRDISTMGTQLGDRAIRIAIKDGDTNRRMFNILRAALGLGLDGPGPETR